MAATTEDYLVAVNNVTWSTPGNDENDSMPIWNGDLAANVWAEQASRGGKRRDPVRPEQVWVDANRPVIRIQRSSSKSIGKECYRNQ
jgi:hypothetical protein